MSKKYLVEFDTFDELTTAYKTIKKNLDFVNSRNKRLITKKGASFEEKNKTITIKADGTLTENEKAVVESQASAFAKSGALLTEFVNDYFLSDTFDVTIQNATSGQSDGSVTINDAGFGTAPYTYLWSTGETTNAISNKEAGTYTCVITDLNGFTYTYTAMIGTAL